jgi:serine-type D-Ala-D-Ala carboxypeptidase/endopeptidase (penicillin-binding protein 4)
MAGALCLAFGARAVPSQATARPAAVAPRLATPLWSPRRAPMVLVSAVTAANLQHQLSGILAPFGSCVAVDGPGGPVARIRPDRALAGASTQKLLVAAAALGVLGTSHRFETRAVTDASLHDGTLDGDLTIVGGGDPMLSTSSVPSTAAAPNTPLSGLADAIVRAGVRRIDGALLADDSRYDRARAVADWKPNYVTEGDVGALGALIVNGGRGDNGIAAADPALDTVQQLASLLSARGVEISGGVSDPGRATNVGGREVARVASPPLDQIVEQMLTVSNDETAELLTRELGVARAGRGTTAAGTREIVAELTRLGVPMEGVVLHDGSGLAPDNRITCASLLGVVALGAQPRFSAVVDGLPIAGRTGTLAGRFGGTTLVGRLRAKTGHIDGVVGLAGVVGAHPRRAERFAFLANGNFSTATGESLQDQTGEAIGRYLDEPDPRNLVPAPH